MWWKGWLRELEGQKVFVVFFFNGEGERSVFAYGFFFSQRGMNAFLREGMVVCWEQMRDDLFTIAETYLPADTNIGYYFMQRMECVPPSSSEFPNRVFYHKA